MTYKKQYLFNAALTVLTVVAVLSFTGCTAARYRKSADKQVYSIIQSAEKEVFGQTNLFDITTPYSGRAPKDIPSAEILENRLRANARMLSLEDALNLAVTNSRRFQAEKEVLYLTALNLTASRHEFRPSFFGRSTIEGDRLAGGEQLGTVRSSGGFSQTLAT